MKKIIKKGIIVIFVILILLLLLKFIIPSIDFSPVIKALIGINPN